MAIIATSNGSQNYAPVEAGNYVARCYSMIHIGTCTEEIMGVKKDLNKVRLTWELPTETKVFKEENGEQPYVLSKEFTLSMHEKASLRATLEAWRGKGFTEDEAKSFDVTKLLGVPCMVNVIHKVSKAGKTFADIKGVTPMPKGLQCPPQINPTFEFSVLEFDEDKFNTLPDFLKDKIKSSKEFKELQQPNNVETHAEESIQQSDDDLPF